MFRELEKELISVVLAVKMQVGLWELLGQGMLLGGCYWGVGCFYGGLTGVVSVDRGSWVLQNQCQVQPLSDDPGIEAHSPQGPAQSGVCLCFTRALGGLLVASQVHLWVAGFCALAARGPLQMSVA